MSLATKIYWHILNWETPEINPLQPTGAKLSRMAQIIWDEVAIFSCQSKVKYTLHKLSDCKPLPAILDTLATLVLFVVASKFKMKPKIS